MSGQEEIERSLSATLDEFVDDVGSLTDILLAAAEKLALVDHEEDRFPVQVCRFKDRFAQGDECIYIVSRAYKAFLIPEFTVASQALRRLHPTPDPEFLLLRGVNQTKKT